LTLTAPKPQQNQLRQSAVNPSSGSRVNGGGSYQLQPFPADRQVIDIGDYYADFSKITHALGWQPRVPLAEGLARTLEYYRMHRNHYW